MNKLAESYDGWRTCARRGWLSDWAIREFSHPHATPIAAYERLAMHSSPATPTPGRLSQLASPGFVCISVGPDAI